MCDISYPSSRNRNELLPSTEFHADKYRKHEVPDVVFKYDLSTELN